MDFDTDSIRNRMITNLRSKASWANILFFSTNQRLIDIVSEDINNLAHYDEYLTRETKWTFAQNLSSLIYQQKYLGYDSHRIIGAKGNIRISSDSGFASPPTKTIEIPKYSIFTNDDATIKVTTIQNESLLTINNYIDVEVVQGIPREFTRTAIGELYEEMEVDNEAIENVTYELYVNNTLWEEIDNMRLAEDGEALVYEIENKPDSSGIILKFGNNIFGKKLEVGDTVVFKYIETLGAGGNITSEDIINKVESSIYDIDSARVEIFVTNVDPIDGGDGAEDIEDIRAKAPNAFQTGDRATTKADYKAILLQNDYVDKANVWGEYEYNQDEGNSPGTFIPLEENVVHVVAFSPGGTALTPTQINEILEYINDFKSPTSIVRFEDVVFIYMVFIIEAFVSDRSYTLSEVQNNILYGDTEDYKGITIEYGIDNMNFEKNIYQSDYISHLDSIPGVNYHNSVINLYNLSVFNSPYESTIAIPLFEITTGTIEVYVKNDVLSLDWTKIGVDNGVGGFTAEAGYDLTGSTINYLTGEGSLIVVSGLTGLYSDYEIKYYYSLVSDNIILTGRNQILRYGESTVTVQYIT